MKNTSLLLLTLFCGSVFAHPQGLLDRLILNKVTKALYIKSEAAAEAFKILKPSEDDIVNLIVPEKEAKINLPLDQHVHVTTQKSAKYAILAATFGLNVKDELKHKAQKIAEHKTTKNAVVGYVIRATLLDQAKDKIVDIVQDGIVDKLPESITERKVHPALKWVASRFAGAALGYVYDQTAGAVVAQAYDYTAAKLVTLTLHAAGLKK